MIEKNEVIRVEIIDLSNEGFGVAKVEGFTVFVESALVGETVDAKIVKVQKRYAIAIIEEIIEASKERVEIKDRLGTITGTMPLQHMNYAAQLKFKQKLVESTLAAKVDLDGVEIFDIKGMKNPWEYRNKAQIPVKMVDGELTTGFYRRRSHDLIPVENFHIQDPRIDESIIIVRDILREHGVTAYDEDTHKGLIRHIIVRQAQHRDDQMVILVTNSKAPISEDIVADIVNAIPNLVSVVQNINTDDTNRITGNKTVICYGQDYYEDKLFGMDFKISSQSFFQVNSDQTEVLYQTALDFSNVTKKDLVMDAYSGIGTISLIMAQKAQHVYGVEMVKEAVLMAKQNAIINNMDNVTFVSALAEDYMKKFIQTKKIDVLLVDPPRKGLHPAFIQSVMETRPRTIVYVSCNPKSLARDIGILSEDYELKKVQPVDMFPQTLHVETVVVLEKIKR